MSVMRYFARHSLVRLATFGIGLVATLLVTPHMFLCLGKDNYGVWALISTLAAYYLLLDFGVMQSVSKLAAAAEVTDIADTAPAPGGFSSGAAAIPGELDRIYTAACCISAAGALLALVIGVVACLSIETMTDIPLEPGTAAAALGIVSVSVAVQLLFRAAFGLLAARMRWTTLAVLTMIRTVAVSAAVLFWLSPARPFGANLMLVALLTAAGNIFEAAALYVLAMRHSRARFKGAALSLAQVKALIRFGVPLLIMSIGNLLRTKVQILLVASFLSLAHTAVFALARQFTNYMDTTMSSVFGIMSPYFSRMQAEGDDDGYRSSLLMSLQLSFTVSGYIGLCLVFYGGLFVTRWLGGGFEDIEGVLTPLALGCALGLGGYPSVAFLIGVGRHSILASVNVLEGVVNVAASIPAVIWYGLPGIGWVFFATTLLFRLGVLPPYISAAAGVPLARYYLTIGGIILCQGVAQTLYFTAIRPLLSPSYAALCVACAGQFAVAAATLVACIRLTGLFITAKRSRGTVLAGQFPEAPASGKE